VVPLLVDQHRSRRGNEFIEWPSRTLVFEGAHAVVTPWDDSPEGHAPASAYVDGESATGSESTQPQSRATSTTARHRATLDMSIAIRMPGENREPNGERDGRHAH
jgi:hypothetical protein